jgi:Glucodextranase, domain B
MTRRTCPALVVALLGLAAPSAHALPVTTSITTPADDARIATSADVPSIMHVAGTSTGVGAVDIVCVKKFVGDTNPTITHLGGTADNVAVAGDGSFSVDVPPPGQSLCRLLAINHGTSPVTDADLAYANGPRLLVARLSFSDSAGKHLDYYGWLTGTQGAYDFDSLSNCTMDDSYVTQGATFQSYVLYCNGWVQPEDPLDATKPDVVVDDHPAYATATMGNGAFTAATSWTPLSASIADDGSQFSLHSHEQLWRCATGTAPDAFPPDSTKCGEVAATGVGVTIDETVSNDGRVATQRLRFISEDGQQHRLSLGILQHLYPAGREFLFPGLSSFATFTGGDSVSPIAPATATILARVPGAADPDATKGMASITYAVTPQSETFFAYSGRSTFVMRYPQVVVPAGKAFRIDFAYATAVGSSELATLRARAEATITNPPVVNLTSPTTVSSSQTTITGKVVAPEPINSVTVNGTAATLASDGTFSLPVTIAANTPTAFTAVATDELGRSGSASQTVTFTPQSQALPPARATIARAGKPRLKGRVLTTGWTVTCTGAGPDCAATVSAKATVPKAARVISAGRRAFTVKAGATAKVRLTLTRSAYRILKRRHKLRLALRLAAARSGAATVTATRAVKLSRRR